MITVPKYFKDKNVLITGGTGFLGKVLIEKILRSCPEVKNIYVLVREKRGKSPMERINEVLRNPLFDLLKSTYPNAVNKIKPLVGDLTKLRLGLSQEDEDLIISSVNIIYHMAATVRFDEHICVAIITNTRSAREAAYLAMQCKNLEVFMHVSTAYCNVDNRTIEERFYPAPMNWEVAIKLAEKGNITSEVLSQKCIGGWPNTYTFSKRLAEAAIMELCSGKLPLVILRPSIVVYMSGDPLPGWNATMNGPFTLTTAMLKGVTSILPADEDAILDMVFVDNVVKSMIMATWEKAILDKSSEVSIYNVSTDLAWQLRRIKECSTLVRTILPHTDRLWYNDRFTLTKCWYYYYIVLILTHITTAFAIDGLLKLSGRKPRLLKITRRVHITLHVLQFFMTNFFVIINNNYKELENKIPIEDRSDFQYVKKTNSQEDTYQIALSSTEGLKKYMFNEPIPVEESTYKNSFRLYVLSRVVSYGLYIFWIYILFWKYDLMNVMYNKMYTYIEQLE